MVPPAASQVDAEALALDASTETSLAIRNVLKLGSSLVATLAIAIVMRLVLPRYLGPVRFGTLTFADAVTTASFVALELGVDAYVRKHVSVRPSHASDFFGGILVLRIALAAVVIGGMAVVMQLLGSNREMRVLVYLLAVMELLVHVNTTLSALLHAKGNVGAMSLLAVVTKIVWAGGVLGAIATASPLWVYALAYLVAEAIKTVALFRLAVRHLGLVLRIDAPATKLMIVASLPYYLNTFATTAYGKLDIALLGITGGDREVGWYAASSAVASLTLLLAPLIGWVLMPTFARAATRSSEDLYARIRWATANILGLAIPASLFLGVGADLWVRLLFGVAFAPATLALRILTMTFVLTYVNIIYAITLVMLERAWTLTLISVCGLGVNIGLNLLLVPRTLVWLGDGGGGAGCAMALLGTEILVTAAMIGTVGRRAFDKPTLSMLAKSGAACVIVIIVDRLARDLGWARMLLDASVYLGIVIATGALRARELVSGLLVAGRSIAASRAQRR